MSILLRFVRAYMGRYLWWYAGGTVALFVTSWLAVTIPLFLADAIDALGEPGGQATVSRIALIVFGMGVATMVVRTLSRVLFFTPGRLVEAEVKFDLFSRILRQQPAFLSQWPTGDLVSRASSDVNNLRLLAGFGALQLINVVAVLVLTLGQMVRLSSELTLWVVAPLLVGLGLTQLSIGWLFIYIKRMQEQLAELSDHTLSSYEGLATIQGFVAEEAFVERFEDLNQRYLRTTLERSALRTVIRPLLEVATAVAVFLLLYMGGPMAIDGRLTTGELVAFTTLVATLAGPLRGLSFLLAILKQAQAALERIEAVTEPEPERPDLPEPVQPPATPPALSIRGLSFAYPASADSDREVVLRDVSIDVPAGGTLGLLGPTGSGKTTLLRCLSRLYNPAPGTVFVDGVDVRALDLDAWRAACVFVPQRAFLFSESLSENILLGGSDPEGLDRVLDLTALGPDVEALPDGVHTEVGESGLRLSGGQRQRSALARGLMREPRVLLLDDVLSAVDHETEHRLIEALRGAGSSPTTVIVAHRISALQHADVIAVLEGGRVVDLGTHDELLERPGLYRDTWDKQREGEEAA